MKTEDTDGDNRLLAENLHRPGDIPDMTKAIDALTATGIGFWRPSEYQLKYERLNYWPRTRRFHLDGGERDPKEMPLAVFIALAIHYHLKATGKAKT